MKKIFSLLAGVVLLISAMTLTACDGIDESASTEATESADDPFGGAPYDLVFVSNGDGTCYVSEIKVNPNCQEKFVLEIPEKSPDGDKVVSVKQDGFKSNVPAIISKSDFDSILTKLLEVYGDDESLTVEQLYEEGVTAFLSSSPYDIQQLLTYYTYIDLESTDIESVKQYWIESYPICEQMPVWVFSSVALQDSRIRCWFGSFLLNDVGFTSFDCAKAHETVEYSNPDEEAYGLGGEFISEIRLASTDTAVELSLYTTCLGLEKLEIPDGVTEIPEFAFYGQPNLAEVTIPNSVTNIGMIAFSACLNLTDITYEGTKEEWEAVEKGENWKSDSIPVHCTDGDVA